jgi:hypothetical protein
MDDAYFSGMSSRGAMNYIQIHGLQRRANTFHAEPRVGFALLLAIGGAFWTTIALAIQHL